MKVCLQEVPSKLKDASTERRKLQKGISEYCAILERNAEKQADFLRFKNNDMNILPPAIDFNSNAIVDISDSDSLIYKSFSLDSIEDDNNVMMADKTDQSDAVQHDGPLLVDQIPVKSFIHLLSGKHLRHYRTNSASMEEAGEGLEGSISHEGSGFQQSAPQDTKQSRKWKFFSVHCFCSNEFINGFFIQVMKKKRKKL